MAAPALHPAVAAGIAAAAGGFGLAPLGPAFAQLANETAANTAAIAALSANVAALTATVAPLPAAVAANTAALALLAPLPAALAALTANVAALNIPALAAGAAAHAHACTLARAENAHDRRGVPLAAVPLAGGPGVLLWPPGFDRAALFEGAVAAVDTLLHGYGLPAGAAAGNHFARRNALALHLGTPRC